jgi:hypothetical protein
LAISIHLIRLWAIRLLLRLSGAILLMAKIPWLATFPARWQRRGLLGVRFAIEYLCDVPIVCGFGAIPCMPGQGAVVSCTIAEMCYRRLVSKLDIHRRSISQPRFGALTLVNSPNVPRTHSTRQSAGI